MPLPPDDIRARLAQLRSEFAMRAALQSEYDKEMSGKYIHEMIPFADWLAQRNAPTGKAHGGQPNLDVMRLAIGGQGPRNFLKGTVEKVTDPMLAKEIVGNREYPHGPELDEATRNRIAELQQTANQPGYVGGAPKVIAHLEEKLKAPDVNKAAMNQWIQRNLGNYIRKQMGHPNDPVRKLAEEGILHFDPDTVPIVGGHENAHEHAESRREMLGGQKMAKGPLAQAWEDAVDSRFEPNLIEDIRAMPDIYRGQHEPWMDKADPKTVLYELYAADELGFNHIVDILKQDLTEGRIRPEQLSKVSIEQAVRRVHQYNQERKKAMAETALKATEGMPVHKDYGDGFKWIELTLPKNMQLPEGYSVKPDPITNRKTGAVDTNSYRLVDPDGELVGWGQTEDEAISSGLGEQKLKDALKYEGDTMGHCVGGYTPDVASGKSRIFSLRDAKNEPHVTVEVKPNDHLDFNKWYEKQPTAFKALINAKKSEPGFDIYEMPEYLAARANVPPAIKQIKGKGNDKPKKDYIPYVQDFVRSGNWSEVNDFRNTDLIRKSDLIDKFSPEDLDAVGKGEYLTHGEHSDLLLGALQPPKGKADGGEVDAEEMFMAKGGKIKELEKYLRDREGEYGLKRLQRAADEIPGLENMYTEEALRRAFGGDNAQALMTMNPADFEKFAIRLYSDPDTREEEMNEPLEYVPGLPPMTHHEYIKYLAKIKGGFADVPFLEIHKKPEFLPHITGHEGRHRSRALAQKGAQTALVRMFPHPSLRESMPRRYREDFIEAMKKQLGEKRLVTGEGRSLLPADLEAPEHKNIERRNMLGGRPQLPEIYKDGGDVDAESAFFPKSKE